MLEIPGPPSGINTSVYRQRTQIGGIDYRLTFHHSSLTDTWSLDIETVGRGAALPEAIITGRKVLIGDDLLRRSTSELRPPGKLVALSKDRTRVAPGLHGFERVRLFYLEPGETLA